MLPNTLLNSGVSALILKCYHTDTPSRQILSCFTWPALHS